MPAATRALIKASLLYLVLALSLAMYQSIHSVAGLSAVYFHLFLVGWVTQMIMGVGFWFFPKYSQARPRGSEPLAWLTFGLLNVGLLLRVLVEPLLAVAAYPVLGWLLVASALLQWLACVLFVYNSWARIKER